MPGAQPPGTISALPLALYPHWADSAGGTADIVTPGFIPVLVPHRSLVLAPMVAPHRSLVLAPMLAPHRSPALAPAWHPTDPGPGSGPPDLPVRPAPGSSGRSPTSHAQHKLKNITFSLINFHSL